LHSVSVTGPPVARVRQDGVIHARVHVLFKTTDAVALAVHGHQPRLVEARETRLLPFLRCEGRGEFTLVGHNGRPLNEPAGAIHEEDGDESDEHQDDPRWKLLQLEHL